MQPIEKRISITEAVRQGSKTGSDYSGASKSEESSSNLSNKSTENEVSVFEKIYQKFSSDKIDTSAAIDNESNTSKSWGKNHVASDLKVKEPSYNYTEQEFYSFPSHFQQHEFCSVWEGICEASDEGRQYLRDVKKIGEPTQPSIKSTDTASSYLDKHVYPILLPALEQTLLTAKELDCLWVQKCRFNGLDYLAEILWNKNPRYKERAKMWTKIHNTPCAKEWLKEHPRPYYPLSWLLSKEQAAIIIQATVRGFLVRNQPEVQEMRQFWKALKREKLEEQRKRQEEIEKWRKQLDEEQKQRKAQEIKHVQVLQEVFKEEEAIRKSCTEQMTINKWKKQ